MKGKIVKCFVTVTAVSAAAVLLFSGCNASNARTAAMISNNSAQRTAAVIKKLENLSDTDFSFPNVLGTDFFSKTDGSNQTAPQISSGGFGYATSPQVSSGGYSYAAENSSNPSSQVSFWVSGPAKTWNFFDLISGEKFVSADSSETQPQKTSLSPQRAVRNTRYKSRFFNMEKLNQESLARTQYHDKLDDLYVLCADISAANAKCKEKVTAIRADAEELKTLAKDLHTSKASGNFAEFNKLNKELNSSITKLYKNRGRVKNRLKYMPSADSAYLNVENMSMRYMVVMNKVEQRLKLLEDVEANIEALKQNIQNMLTNAPVKQTKQNTQSIKQITGNDSQVQPKDQAKTNTSRRPSLLQRRHNLSRSTDTNPDESQQKKSFPRRRAYRAPEINENNATNESSTTRSFTPRFRSQVPDSENLQANNEQSHTPTRDNKTMPQQSRNRIGQPSVQPQNTQTPQQTQTNQAIQPSQMKQPQSETQPFVLDDQIQSDQNQSVQSDKKFVRPQNQNQSQSQSNRTLPQPVRPQNPYPRAQRGQYYQHQEAQPQQHTRQNQFHTTQPQQQQTQTQSKLQNEPQVPQKPQTLPYKFKPEEQRPAI